MSRSDKRGSVSPQVTERAHAVNLVAKVLGITRKLPAVPKSSPFGGAGTPSGVTERVHSPKPKRLPRKTEQPFWFVMKRRK